MNNKKFEESGYCFSFLTAKNAVKADEKNYAQLSSVDFIVETDSSFLFIEVKNADTSKSKEEAKMQFLKKVGDRKFPVDTVKKFSDTLMAQLAMGATFPKPIRFIYIVEFSMFGSHERLRLVDEVNNRMPWGLKNKIFTKVKSLTSFELLTVEKFRTKYPDFNIEPCD